MHIDTNLKNHVVMTADGLSDVLDWLDATPATWARTASTSDYDGNFYGTNNLPQAFALARNGWSDGVKAMSDGMDQAAMLKPAKPIQTQAYDIGGAYPDVSLYCAGVPDHMVSLTPEDSQTRPIYRFVIGLFASAVVEKATITNRGAAILSWVDKLEAEGARVEVMAAMLVQDSGKTISLGFTVKRADEALELDRLAFVLAHPSMFRRLGFAAMERHKAMEATFTNGYGAACDTMPAIWNAPNSVYFPCLKGSAPNQTYGNPANAMATVEGIIKAAITRD